MNIHSITLEAADPAAAATFYKTAFGLEGQVDVRHGDAATDGFRGYTLSLVTTQPANVDTLVEAALAEGATIVKPATRSLWGYGGAVQAPDGAIWTIACSKKKNTTPAARTFDDLVLLLGVRDVRASRAFYVEHGLKVARSFGGKYVEFEPGAGAVKLGLNVRKDLAKNAGVPPEGTGSHRLVVNGDGEAFTDPDGFSWEPASA